MVEDVIAELRRCAKKHGLPKEKIVSGNRLYEEVFGEQPEPEKKPRKTKSSK